MTKTICDICGKDMPLEIYSRSTKDYKFCISSYGKVWDVCAECRDELNEWMKKRKAERIAAGEQAGSAIPTGAESEG